MINKKGIAVGEMSSSISRKSQDLKDMEHISYIWNRKITKWR